MLTRATVDCISVPRQQINLCKAQDAKSVRPSVCLSVCLSHTDKPIVLQTVNRSSSDQVIVRPQSTVEYTSVAGASAVESGLT